MNTVELSVDPQPVSKEVPRVCMRCGRPIECFTQLSLRKGYLTTESVARRKGGGSFF